MAAGIYYFAYGGGTVAAGSVAIESFTGAAFAVPQAGQVIRAQFTLAALTGLVGIATINLYRATPAPALLGVPVPGYTVPVTTASPPATFSPGAPTPVLLGDLLAMGVDIPANTASIVFSIQGSILLTS